jgi:hypothetical protein
MRQKWVLLLAVAFLITAATFVRIGYRSLGWGGYWYVEVR